MIEKVNKYQEEEKNIIDGSSKANEGLPEVEEDEYDPKSNDESGNNV